MNDSTVHSILIVAVSAIITALLRGLPFVIFGSKTPKFILFLSKFLPYAVMGMLVVYCLKDASFTAFPFALPEFIAIAAVALQWKSTKNHLPAIIGVISTAVCLAVFGSEDFLIPSMIVITVLLFALRKPLEKKAEVEEDE